jgi:two-component system OmpR family response regulator
MAGSGRGGAIMIVDDDAATREAVYAVAREAGYRVARAASHAEALEALAHARFDLVLIDVRLAAAAAPPGDEQAVASRVEHRAGYRPAVLLTAYRAGGQGAPGLAAGPLVSADPAAVLAAIRRRFEPPG